mmetsp:Transcript_46441/g.120133  ORF Transcript_46441/g.120133 Transcript_46441/m.120133 type:complete len:328 (-) Transcript_46441:1688-2671(-)
MSLPRDRVDAQALRGAILREAHKFHPGDVHVAFEHGCLRRSIAAKPPPSGGLSEILQLPACCPLWASVSQPTQVAGKFTSSLAKAQIYEQLQQPIGFLAKLAAQDVHSCELQGVILRDGTPVLPHLTRSADDLIEELDLLISRHAGVRYEVGRNLPRCLPGTEAAALVHERNGNIVHQPHRGPDEHCVLHALQKTVLGRVQDQLQHLVSLLPTPRTWKAPLQAQARNGASARQVRQVDLEVLLLRVTPWAPAAHAADSQQAGTPGGRRVGGGAEQLVRELERGQAQHSILHLARLSAGGAHGLVRLLRLRPAVLAIAGCGSSLRSVA